MNIMPNNRYEGKIFNFGLSRTGTTSLTEALIELGYFSKHYPIFPLEAAERYDALTDISVLAMCDHIIARYPTSKYIVTIRDKDTWLVSTIKHFEGSKENIKYFRLRLYRKLIYGKADPAKTDEFLKTYDEQYKKIFNKVNEHKLDYIVMNICNGDGWEKLCPFLGVDIPDIKFPNTGKYPGGYYARKREAENADGV